MIGTSEATTIHLPGQRHIGLLQRLATWFLAPVMPTSDHEGDISITGNDLHARPADRIAGDGGWSQGRWARLA